MTGDGTVSRRLVMRNALAYVAGFSFIFVMLGVALGAAGSFVETANLFAGNRDWLVRIGGVIVLMFGLQQIGLIAIPGLGRTFRLEAPAEANGSVSSSFLIGLTFGAGWSPCAGPILGAILTMAAGQGRPAQSATMLAVYSAGLAVPFLGMAWFGSSKNFIRRIGNHLNAVMSVSGGVMVAIGVIMLLGIYQQLFSRIAAVAPWRPFEPSLFASLLIPWSS